MKFQASLRSIKEIQNLSEIARTCIDEVMIYPLEKDNNGVVKILYDRQFNAKSIMGIFVAAPKDIIIQTNSLEDAKKLSQYYEEYSIDNTNRKEL